MYYFLVFLHIFVSIAMIGIVLLQSGKGAEMGASFGAGGSQTVFGASGGNTFMSRLTTSAAVLFMLTSLTLAHLSSTGSSSSIMPTKSAPAAPAKGAAPAQMPAPAPTAPATPVAPVQAPAAPVK
jgi:preprotein translocase subunit SecG